MKRLLLFSCCALLVTLNAFAQGRTASPASTPMPQAPVRQASATQGLTEYGVTFQPEPRLIIMMAALEAAGFDPTPANRQPSELRLDIRQAQSGISEDLRQRMRNFYENNRYKEPGVTPAQQAARYVSLALALGAPPSLDVPERSDDLPGDVLEVLDFAPLLREFYRASNISERLPSYVELHRKQGEALRSQTAEMVRSVLSYLHMRPMITAIDRVPVKSESSSKKKKEV
ncbi:MAG: hypothetical protein WKF84_16450 [Pyrinomonadaceae bacterium]